MGIIRLALLAVLGYIAWLLLRDFFPRTPAKTGRQPAKPSAPGEKVQDVLMEDPVCHTLVPKNQAIRLRRDGKTYYFCSEGCCDKFAAQARGEE